MAWPTNGFQSGWLRNINGTQGKRWYLVQCGRGCAISEACINCPGNSHLNKTRGVHWLVDNLLDPLSWKVRYSVFACPEGDLFHVDIPDEFIYQVFSVMESCPQHRFVLTTKRAERMGDMLTDPSFPMRVYDAGKELLGDRYINRCAHWGDNILIGVSVESQKYMDRALVLPDLPKSMTKIMFVAPMLGEVKVPEEVLKCLGWVLCNGERGSAWCKPRPCKLEWQKDLADQCSSHDVPFYLLRNMHHSWVSKMGGRSYREFPAVLHA